MIWIGVNNRIENNIWYRRNEMKKLQLLREKKMKKFFKDGGLTDAEVNEMNEPFPVYLSFRDMYMLIKFKRRIYPSIVIAVLCLQIIIVFMINDVGSDVAYITIFCLGVLIEFVSLALFRRVVKEDSKKMVKQIMENKLKIK
jgi:hypothetical protein